MPEPCAAILLAAGASTRLGQPKQLIAVDGETLLHRAARLASEAGCKPVLVVLGYEAARMQQELGGLEASAVIHEDWASGMGSSLRSGIAAMMREAPVPRRTLVLLCDQPALSAEFLSNLLEAGAQAKSLITASGYAGRLGVPAVFDQQLYPDLLKVEGDQGARSVIQRYIDQTTTVAFPGGILDIDTPADLANLTSRR